METEREVPERCEPAPDPPYLRGIGFGLLVAVLVFILPLGWYFGIKSVGGGAPYVYAAIQAVVGISITSAITVVPNLHEACHKYTFRYFGYENAQSYNWNAIVPFAGPPHAVATGQHIAKKHWPAIEMAPLVVETLLLGGIVLALEHFAIPIVDPIFTGNNLAFLFQPYAVFASAGMFNIGPSWGDIYQTYYFHKSYDTDATAYFVDTTVDQIRVPRVGWEIPLPFGKELHTFDHYYCPDPDSPDR